MRLTKWLTPVVVLIMCVAALSPNAVAAQWSLTTGTEITERDDKYLEIAIQSQKQKFLNWKGSLLKWSSKPNLCGSVILGQTTRWQPELGVCYGERDFPGVNSLGKYRIGIWYKARKRVSVGLLHYSCNKHATRRLLFGLDIIPRCSRGTRNKGINFFAVEIRQ